MSRQQGIEMVLKYDHVKPSDLQRWLNYVGMSEHEFDITADKFRDPRVWSQKDGKWWKLCVDGKTRAYEKIAK